MFYVIRKLIKLITQVFPPGIQPNRVGGCGLGMVNSYIKHSLAHIKGF